MGFRSVGFPPACHPATGVSDSYPGGSNSRWTHQPFLDAQPDGLLSQHPPLRFQALASRRAKATKSQAEREALHQHHLAEMNADNALIDAQNAYNTAMSNAQDDAMAAWVGTEATARRDAAVADAQARATAVSQWAQAQGTNWAAYLAAEATARATPDR